MKTNILRTKCVVLGDPAVGKTAINEVFLSNGTNFPKNYVMTCGVKLDSKAVNIPDTNDIVVGMIKLELYLFDSSGKDVYIDLLHKYCIDASLIAIVFDVTNEASLKNCAKWHKLLQPSSGKNLAGVLLANKTDLTDRRVVTPKAGQEMAKACGLQYFECSAKEMQNVEEPFFYLANECHKSYLENKESS